MKTVPTALQAHLDTGATTLCWCWRLTRRDATVLGFTEHDQDLVCDGTTFGAASGFTASQIQQSLGLVIDSLEAAGALSDASISEADILAGRYDDATIELIRVNWSDPTQYLIAFKGSLGQVKRQGAAFTAELRGLAHRLNQQIGRTYQRYCDANLGDSRCTINLALPAYVGTATMATGGVASLFQATGLSGFAAGWFSGGVMTFSTGLNAGLKFEIKTHTRTAGADYLSLWSKTPFAAVIGDAAAVVAGCSKDFATCKSKFANKDNFRGFPHIPPADSVTRFAQQANGERGGSLFS